VVWRSWVLPLGSRLTRNRTPPNCTFEVDDLEQDWVYHNKFDYIHARELGGCVADDEKLFRQAFEHLAPGGYFEMQAVYPRFLSDDGTAGQAKDAQFWMKNICEGAVKFGKPLDSAPGWLEKMKAAGFVDVKQEIRKVSPLIYAHERRLR
jgi:trans-aconitate methyltransferase